jgi:prepilin-type N-terminal cleavage/methylation domain-containing protein
MRSRDGMRSSSAVQRMPHRRYGFGGRSVRIRGRSGFTLLEMIIVVAIIGIIVAIAAVRMDYLIPKYRLRGGAREVGALFREARSRAAAMGRDTYVQVDVSKGEYWMLAPFRKLNEDGTPAEPPAWEYEEVFRRSLPAEGGSTVEFVDVLLGADQKIATGRALMRFTPQGVSNHVIVNLRLAEKTMAVRMNGLTGALAFSDTRMEADALLEDVGD